MPISIEQKKEYVKKFGKGSHDTGSSEVQIAILTHRIRELTEHLKTHKKDRHTRRGLVMLVAKRKKIFEVIREIIYWSIDVIYISVIKTFWSIE